MKHFKIAAILLISLLAAMNLVGSQIRLRNRLRAPRSTLTRPALSVDRYSDSYRHA